MSLVWFITQIISAFVIWWIITLLGFNQPSFSFQWIGMVVIVALISGIIANVVDGMFKK